MLHWHTSCHATSVCFGSISSIYLSLRNNCLSLVGDSIISATFTYATSHQVTSNCIALWHSVQLNAMLLQYAEASRPITVIILTIKFIHQRSFFHRRRQFSGSLQWFTTLCSDSWWRRFFASRMMLLLRTFETKNVHQQQQQHSTLTDNREQSTSERTLREQSLIAINSSVVCCFQDWPGIPGTAIMPMQHAAHTTSQPTEKEARELLIGSHSLSSIMFQRMFSSECFLANVCVCVWKN